MLPGPLPAVMQPLADALERGGSLVEAIAVGVRGEERRLELSGADAGIRMTLHPELIAVLRPAEVGNACGTAREIGVEIGHDAVLRAGLAARAEVGRALPLNAVLIADGPPVGRATFLGIHPRAAAERQQEDRERHPSHERTIGAGPLELASPVMSGRPPKRLPGPPISGGRRLDSARQRDEPKQAVGNRLKAKGDDDDVEDRVERRRGRTRCRAARPRGHVSGRRPHAPQVSFLSPRSGRPPPEEHGPGQVVRPGRPPAARAATGAAVPMARDRPAVISCFCEAIP